MCLSTGKWHNLRVNLKSILLRKSHVAMVRWIRVNSSNNFHRFDKIYVIFHFGGKSGDFYKSDPRLFFKLFPFFGRNATKNATNVPSTWDFLSPTKLLIFLNNIAADDTALFFLHRGCETILKLGYFIIINRIGKFIYILVFEWNENSSPTLT